MMGKFKILLGFACLLTTAIVNAQTSASVDNIKGTPYLDEKFVDGVIHYSNKTLSAAIRYNAFQDLIEYKNNGQALALDPNLSISKVSFGTSTFVPLSYDNNGKSKLGYFLALDSGKVKLYAKKKIVYMPAKKGGALDGGDLPAQFKPGADAFFYSIEDGTLQEVGNMKSMIASFPDKQDELTQYAKKEKISPRKEKDIAQFVKYYNSMFDASAMSASNPR